MRWKHALGLVGVGAVMTAPAMALTLASGGAVAFVETFGNPVLLMVLSLGLAAAGLGESKLGGRDVIFTAGLFGLLYGGLFLAGAAWADEALPLAAPWLLLASTATAVLTAGVCTRVYRHFARSVANSDAAEAVGGSSAADAT